jgi:hypothetical protein
MADDERREHMAEILKTCHRLRESSEIQAQEAEKSRIRTLELLLISRKLLATAKLITKELLG